MLQHTFIANDKSVTWLEISTQEDLAKYINYAKALSISEFNALIKMDERGITHNRWESPITKLAIRMRSLGKSLIIGFAESEAMYLNQITSGFDERGIIFINSAGGYNYNLDMSAFNVVTKTIDKIEANLISISIDTTNLILENDAELDEGLVAYMDKNKLKYSSITQLRLAATNGDLMRGISLIMDSNDNKKINLYIKTSGLDIEQIHKMLEKLERVIGEIHVDIPDDMSGILDDLQTDYPKIKFVKIDTL